MKKQIGIMAFWHNKIYWCTELLKQLVNLCSLKNNHITESVVDAPTDLNPPKVPTVQYSCIFNLHFNLI